ncbi:MAG TPA: hypothetical protein VMH84_12185 [Xanthobacteraceae bacterium]|nr:hypothetical protein [Xanthobacteraceae bacterium]
MHKLIIAAAAIAALTGVAAVAAPGSSQGVRAAAEQAAITQDAAFIFGGHRHCWYTRGWNGPGWYWCGYSHRHGHGWGGAEGWNGWRHR